MTSERKKTILILWVTLATGILIGLLVPGLFNKYQGYNQHRGGGGRGGSRSRDHDRETEYRQSWFAGTINRIVKPDSMQAKQIKPITDWATQQFTIVENSSNSQLSAIMDSVNRKLKPILTANQLQRLNDFNSRAKKQWNGGRRGDRRH